MSFQEIISKGDFIPTIKEGDKIVTKPISASTHEETKKVAKNYRALNILFCGLDSNKVNHMSSYEITKEVQDTLETTHEGISQVRESKISLYVHQYELLKMLPEESIKDMYMRFIEIFNNLKSFGKTQNNEEMVRKVLRCLLRSKQEPKVVAIQEPQDLKALKLDDLVGKLLTHEIHLQEENEEHIPQ